MFTILEKNKKNKNQLLKRITNTLMFWKLNKISSYLKIISEFVQKLYCTVKSTNLFVNIICCL